MKQNITQITRHPLFGHMLRLPEQIHPHRSGEVRVLTYHKISHAAAFEKQMAYVARHYHLVSMATLLTAVTKKRPLPARTLLITFDDAYRNFAECAWPILKKYQLPVTLFVPTAYPDNPHQTFWWEQLQASLMATECRGELNTAVGSFDLSPPKRKQTLKQLKRLLVQLPYQELLTEVEQIRQQLKTPKVENEVLSWHELRHLAQEGVTLGAHTQTHPVLTQIPIAEAKAEVAGSISDLAREVGDVLPVFAYPGGFFNDEVVTAVSQAGIQLAFTTTRGTNMINEATPLRLRRNNIGHQAEVSDLRIRLLHSSALLNSWRKLDKK